LLESKIAIEQVSRTESNSYDTCAIITSMGPPVTQTPVTAVTQTPVTAVTQRPARSIEPNTQLIMC